MGISRDPALTLGLVSGVASMVAMVGRQLMAAWTVRTHERERRETIISVVRDATRNIPAGGMVVIVCTSTIPADAIAGAVAWPTELLSCPDS